MEGVKKFVTWIISNHPDARGEIKRVFADGDHVILHSHWHGLSDNPRGEAVGDIFRLEGAKAWSPGDGARPPRRTRATPPPCSNLPGHPRFGHVIAPPPTRAPTPHH